MKIIAATILLSACATTSRSLPVGESGRTSAPRLATTTTLATDDAKPWFPALATEAALPSIAHSQRELSTTADRFELGVRICVAPNGSVASVDVERSSGIAQIDRAALQDIPNWRYEPFTAPTRVRVCKQLGLAFEPHAEASPWALPLVRTPDR